MGGFPIMANYAFFPANYAFFPANYAFYPANYASQKSRILAKMKPCYAIPYHTSN
jgi:hypothetical protein